MKKIIILALVLLSNLAIAEQFLYVIQSDDNILNRISLTSGQRVTALRLELADTSPVSGLDVEVDPITGQLFIIGDTSFESESGRFLGTVNLSNGVVTNIGSLDNGTSSIAFTSDGTLYAVTGDGASNNEELYTVNVTDGSMTFVMSLGNGNDGEVIVYNPNDGLLYHGSSDTIETINPVSLVITPVSSGSAIAEITGMGFNSGNSNGDIFVIDRSEDVYSVSQSGVVTLLVDNVPGESGEFRGAAIAPPPPTIPVVSIYGLLSLSVGIFMLLVIARKRKII